VALNSKLTKAATDTDKDNRVAETKVYIMQADLNQCHVLQIEILILEHL
jgi:hypothetical protein